MNEEFSFMKEKIKDKPFYKRRWVQLLAGTVVLALLFGLISGCVFMKVTTHLKDKQEQEAIKNVEIPKDNDEEIASMQPEEKEPEAVTEPEPIVIDQEISVDDYRTLMGEFRKVAKEARKALVTVTAVSNDVDWFNEAYENLGQSSGMIIGDNGVELLILTKYSAVENSDDLHVTFTDKTKTTAALKKYDVTTDLAVISVNLSDIPEDTSEKIKKAELGNSRVLEAGVPVMAVGRADGSENSLMIGYLTSVHNSQSVVDAEYTILMTDMIRHTGSEGVLINLKGEVIGVIQNKYLMESRQDCLSAYAISDIKGLLEHLSNNQDITYLGIKGTSVTEEASLQGIPEGVYVTEVELDSPAMKGGIQSGDVIRAINGQNVTTMTELSDVLQRLSNKQNITLECSRLTKDGYKQANYQASLSVLE